MTTNDKRDLEHTFEFINRGEQPWLRADGEALVRPGESFRALAAELPAIEAEPERFELARTLPYPPADCVKPARKVSGFQRREPRGRKAAAGQGA